MDIIFRMLFLTLNNADIQFAEENFIRRTYTAVDALLITKKVQIIN